MTLGSGVVRMPWTEVQLARLTFKQLLHVLDGLFENSQICIKSTYPVRHGAQFLVYRAAATLKKYFTVFTSRLLVL